MKSFWESGTLFPKRVLAAGGKVVVDLRALEGFTIGLPSYTIKP
jgi:hypothetical protein